MSFLNFLGQSLQPGYAPIAKGEALSLQRQATMKEYPYRLAGIQDQASNSRLAANEAVTQAGYDQQYRDIPDVAPPGLGITGRPSQGTRAAPTVKQPAPTAPAVTTAPVVSTTTTGLPAGLNPQTMRPDFDERVPAPARVKPDYAALRTEREAEIKKLEQQAITADPVTKNIFRRNIQRLESEIEQLNTEEKRFDTRGRPALSPVRSFPVEGAPPPAGLAPPAAAAPVAAPPAAAAPTQLPSDPKAAAFVQGIPAAAQAAGVSEAYLRRLAGGENPSMDPDVKNPRSSAKGFLQITDATAKDYKMTNRTDPQEQLRVFVEKTRKDTAAFMRRMGRPPNEADLSLMWQQGQSGGIALLANPDKLAKDVLKNRDAVADNLHGDLKNMADTITARQLVDYVQNYYNNAPGVAMTPGQTATSNSTFQPAENFNEYADFGAVNLDMRLLENSRELLQAQLARANNRDKANPGSGIADVMAIAAQINAIDAHTVRVSTEQGIMQAQAGYMDLLNWSLQETLAEGYEVVPFTYTEGGPIEGYDVKLNGGVVQADLTFPELKSWVYEATNPEYRAQLFAAKLAADVVGSEREFEMKKIDRQFYLDTLKSITAAQIDINKIAFQGTVDNENAIAEANRKLEGQGIEITNGADGRIYFSRAGDNKPYYIDFTTEELNGEEVEVPNVVGIPTPYTN
jgi:hypothetical protein